MSKASPYFSVVISRTVRGRAMGCIARMRLGFWSALATSGIFVALAPVGAQDNFTWSNDDDLIAVHERWRECLVEALAVYASLREEPNTIIDASLARCRRLQDEAIHDIFSVRRRAGFPVDGAIIEELTKDNVQSQRDWMLPALLEMRLNGLAPSD